MKKYNKIIVLCLAALILIHGAGGEFSGETDTGGKAGGL